ncbi:RICIN domain-containing protein [Massilia endophytica]|uniref:RICIN domain-containing protein n=1 Tax=Massilia endophytica TaxID=2899220 RepID=UPI001E35B5CD|nr:RICIN domain-containing protein [Massilia endophytica]UGQ45722.1 RICIN domain-containing protein [Massilia endophytica]
MSTPLIKGILEKYTNQQLIAKFAPALCYHTRERYRPCSIEFLLNKAVLLRQPLKPDGEVDWDAQGTVVADKLTPNDLGANTDKNLRLQLHSDAYAGQPWNEAPVYVSVQRDPNGVFIDINYHFLFAYNGAQTMRALRPGDDFNCIVPTYGEHEGDLESYSVRLSAAPGSSEPAPVRHRFEAHGNDAFYCDEEVLRVDGKVLVGLAFNSHAAYNMKGKNPADWQILPGGVDIGEWGAHPIDVLPDSIYQRWSPAFIEIGIDAQGQAVNRQSWVQFRGRLGRHGTSKYTRATGIYGDLTSDQRGFVELGLKLAGGLPSNQQGPMGPQGRTTMRQDKPIDPSLIVAVRLQARSDLALSVDLGNPAGDVVVRAYRKSEEQLWYKLHQGGGNYCFVNVASGLAAAGGLNRSKVWQTPLVQVPKSLGWSLKGAAIRPANNSDQNLNVPGNDDHPNEGPVWVWDWGGGRANECWTIAPPVMPVYQDRVRIALRYKSGSTTLVVSADDAGAVRVQPLADGDEKQLWDRLRFDDEGGQQCYAFFNAKTGKALLAKGYRQNLAVDGKLFSIWNCTDVAIRFKWDTGQNFNVAGSDQSPGAGSAVCLWDWGGGNPNERWEMQVVKPYT